MAEFPHLQQIYEQFREKGLGVVAVNPVDSAERIRQYLERGKFTLPAALDSGPPGEAPTVGARFRVRAYPSTFLIAGDGRIVGRWVGYDLATMEEIRAALSALGL